MPKKRKDRTGRTGTVFWIAPFMDPPPESGVTGWEHAFSMVPVRGWMEVKVTGWLDTEEAFEHAVKAQTRREAKRGT